MNEPCGAGGGGSGGSSHSAWIFYKPGTLTLCEANGVGTSWGSPALRLSWV